MKDYNIITHSTDYKYLYHIYQKELENRIDSLIHYQQWEYPFFRLINNTSRSEAEFFKDLCQNQSLDFVSNFPTNNQTLYDLGILQDACVVNNGVVTESFKILFINKLNKHQGVVIFDNSIYICFLSKQDLRNIPDINEIAGILYFSQKIWNQINYKPSIINYTQFYLQAKSSMLTRNSGIYDAYCDSRFASSTDDYAPRYRDFSVTDPSAEGAFKWKGFDINIFKANSISNLDLSHFAFRDQNNNFLAPSISNANVLLHIPIGMVVFSNTSYHDVDSSMDKVLLFHLSNFSWPFWKISNGKMQIKIQEDANEKYGSNIWLSMPTVNMRFITNRILEPTFFTVSVDMFALYTDENSQTQTYKKSSEKAIIQPSLEVNNVYEEFISDFFYNESISKIDQTTEYHYTITNKSNYNQNIKLITI